MYMTMRSQLRFAGRSATSQWVVLPALFLLAFNVTDRVGLTDEQSLNYLHALVLASSLAWLVFTLSGLLIGLIPLTSMRVRAAAVLTLYAVTEVVRTCSLHLFAVQFGVPSEANWAFRITA